MEPILTVSNLSLHFGTKTIFNDISFAIPKGSVVGLVGRNGSGKSTLLRFLSGNSDPDTGDIALMQGATIGYLSQNVELEQDLTVYQAVASGFLIKDTFFDYKNLDRDLHWEIDEKIQKILSDFNAPQSDLILNTLSGGQKRVVAICRCLVSNPDLIILDEPTNHLDIPAIERLESYLKNLRKTIILVSHDRYFMDRVSDTMLEIYAGNIYGHGGNYSQYLQSKKLRLEISETQELHRKQHLKREIQWVRAGVQARGTKDKGRLKRYGEVLNTLPPKQPEILALPLPQSSELGNVILNFFNAKIVTPNGKVVSEKLEYKFKLGDKIGLIGNNGSGKTTLIETILYEAKKDSNLKLGKIVVGLNTKFNYIDQEKEFLKPNNTIFEEVAGSQETLEYGENETMSSRKYLEYFLFEKQGIYKTISELSGGEKARVALCKELKRGGNFLILDEPTNDLDLETIEALEIAIKSFTGCVIVISHDRFFLNQTCNHIFALNGEGEIKVSTGNYDEYQQKYQPATSKVFNTSKSDPVAKMIKKQIQDKIVNQNKLNLEIQKLEKEILELESKFGEVDFYTNNQKDIITFTNRISKRKEKLDQFYNQWLELEE